MFPRKSSIYMTSLVCSNIVSVFLKIILLIMILPSWLWFLGTLMVFLYFKLISEKFDSSSLGTYQWSFLENWFYLNLNHKSDDWPEYRGRASILWISSKAIIEKFFIAGKRLNTVGLSYLFSSHSSISASDLHF